MGLVLAEKKNPVRSLNPYVQNGYTIHGNHLVKDNKDGSKTYILMYERNLLKR